MTEGAASATADDTSAEPQVAPDGAGEALPVVVQSNRLLWIGAGVALAAHLVPFVYWNRTPDPLGDGVLTEAIAVELVDKATLEGRDQTPPTPPAQAAPPPAPPSPPQTQPGPPQKPQQAIAPSPPPAPPPPKTEGEAKEQLKSERLPAFDGEGDQHRAKEEKPKAEKAPEEPPREMQKPAPKRPPPQKAAEPRAPAPAPHASAKPSPPRQPSETALAKSGEVTQFAKEVVAALAKAKPVAPRTKENTPIKGKVQVTVVVAPQGGIRYAKVTGPSGNEELDKLALEAARKATVPTPPPDVTTDDLFYDVEYNFK